MISVINEIRERLVILERMVSESNISIPTSNVTPQNLDYVNLREGTNKDKLGRIVKQINRYIAENCTLKEY